MSIIKDIKIIIKTKINIDLQEQKFFFSGKELDDLETLLNAKIQNYSVLQLNPLEIEKNFNSFVIFNDNNPFHTNKIIILDYKSSNTIKDLKLKIEEKENIPIKGQTLYYLKQELENEKTLIEYNIEKENSLSLHISLESLETEKDFIFVKSDEYYKKIKVDICLSDTILDIKKIERQAKIQTTYQKLIFEGKILENNKFISEYGIKNESIILLINEQTINFKFLNGKCITLSYFPLNTIEYYKKWIYNKTLIIQENQSLIFKRMELENNKTIIEYNIEQTSIIYIIKRLASEEIYSNIFPKINYNK